MSAPDPSKRDGEVRPFDPYAPVDYPADDPGSPGHPVDYGVPPGYRAEYQWPPGYAPVPTPVYPVWYPASGFHAYRPYVPTAPPGTNAKAIAALVCALTGLLLCLCFLPSLAAIVLGVAGISETRRTGQAGFGLATTGVAIGVCTVLLVTGLLIAGTSGYRG